MLGSNPSSAIDPAAADLQQFCKLVCDDSAFWAWMICASAALPPLVGVRVLQWLPPDEWVPEAWGN